MSASGTTAMAAPPWPDPGRAWEGYQSFPRLDGHQSPHTHTLRGANDGMLHTVFRVANGVDVGLHPGQPVGI